MKLLFTHTKKENSTTYFYYIDYSDGGPYYNVVPEGTKPPESGYKSAAFICKAKGVPNHFETLTRGSKP